MNLQTERLQIRKLTIKDAPFFFELVNDPDWKRFIGDRNVQTIKDAEDYLTNRIMKSYKDFGFGFYLVVEATTTKSIGITGFIKRNELDFVDVGFAFLPMGRGKGYAFESTKAIINYGKQVLNFSTILGIANNDNVLSHKLLKKLGLQYKQQILMEGETKKISLFST